MKRTPEQDLAREARRRATMSIPKCACTGCNQRRTLESELCGDHLRDHRAAVEQHDERQALVHAILSMETMDDLKSVLLEMLR